MPRILNTRWLFIGSCLFFAFLYGFMASHFQWFPSSFLAPALDQANQVTAPYRKHMHPAKHDLVGVETHGDDGATSSGGLTLLTSHWSDNDGRAGIRLIDRRGAVVHAWDVDAWTMWAGSSRLADWENPYIHGSYLFDNGDVLFNLDYIGLSRINARGEVLWQLDRPTHHSIHRADDGTFWVCEHISSDSELTMAARYPGLVPPFGEARVLNVSPDGEILRELSVLDVVYDSELRWILWQSSTQRTGDILHLNDVEPLPAAMAGQYPLFEAGDLLVSLCWVNLVLVFDPDTKQIKWSTFGEAIGQHDPDFIGEGWISVFDNRRDYSPDGRFLGSSRLIAIRPHTNETRQIYPPPGTGSPHERPFHTDIGGKAQLLPDGHWLLTDAQWGRVFEIDERGYTVWEWGHERHADGWISEVLEGTRYDISPDAVRQWTNR